MLWCPKSRKLKLFIKAAVQDDGGQCCIRGIRCTCWASVVRGQTAHQKLCVANPLSTAIWAALLSSLVLVVNVVNR